jgi:8-oxo-dGTP pyrophosphatase MutT (NUDIX family)
MDTCCSCAIRSRRYGIRAAGVCSAAASSPAKTPVDALKRELREELELEIETAEFFARFDFDIGGLRLPRFYRNYYVVSISRAVEQRLVVHEGAAKRLFSGNEILEEPNVTPYDAFALFLYHARGRLTVSA